MRRAKIVCTLGPATASLEKIRSLVGAGMDVARINASHGNFKDHAQNAEWVRQAAEESGRAVAVLVDLQGPKIRLGTFADGPIMLNKGDTFTITTDDIEGDKDIASTTYKGLPGDCQVGDSILIDDGKVGLEVTEVRDNAVVTTVIVAGPVSNNKGINLPGVAVSVPALSEKDKDDLRSALDIGADFIALSFVRNAIDVDDVHRIMDEVGIRVPIIAKIEKPQAVDHLDEIVDAFDGIMVARGDLGVELPLEDVPLVQKRAIEIARRRSKPVIVATQVLESMVTNPRPTRAEASDCANAILDGADAVMLSGETSVGDYPIECVETMARIITVTEERGGDRISPLGASPLTRSGVIARAATDMATLLNVSHLVTFTQSGDTARRLSRLRSAIPLLAFTPEEATRRRLALTWGVHTFLVPSVTHTDAMVEQVDRVMHEDELADDGESVVLIAGTPPGRVGSTNMVRIHRIGEVLRSGHPQIR